VARSTRGDASAALRCRIEPGIGSMQLACAVLGFSWQDAACFDLREEIPMDLPNDVQPHATSLFRMGAVGAEAIVAEIAEMYEQQCAVVEDVSLATESVLYMNSTDLAKLEPHARRFVVLSRELERG
jgi:precorrin-6B methylase 1